MTAMEKELRTRLITVADAYRALNGPWAEATIAHRVVRNGDFLRHMREGDRGFNIRKFDQLMNWYSANWPDGADWPDEIPRPGALLSPPIPSEAVAAAAPASSSSSSIIPTSGVTHG